MKPTPQSILALENRVAEINAAIAKSEKALKSKKLKGGKFLAECDWFDHLQDVLRSAEVALEEAKKNA